MNLKILLVAGFMILSATRMSLWAAGVQEPLKAAIELHDAGIIAEAITE